MKVILVFVFELLLSTLAYAQQQGGFSSKAHKGQIFAYWGWNRAWYTKSDLHFKGNNYDFILDKVVAKDRQTPFAFDPYFAPTKITIPQTNFRVGYFFWDNWNISIGVDHMKYVMQQNQNVTITGNIQNSNTIYDGTFEHQTINLKSDFLQFEHTDGLNYVNISLQKMTNCLNLRRFHLPNIDLNVAHGIGIGFLYPRTNTKLLGNERYDEFQITGYGLDLNLGVNVIFFEHFFVQSNLKGGFINMPNIRTTMSSSDKAQQYFYFLQSNVVFGGIFRI